MFTYKNLEKTLFDLRTTRMAAAAQLKQRQLSRLAVNNGQCDDGNR
jgi:hypothetical protein